MTNQTDVTTRPPGVQERVEPTPPGEWREVMLGEIAEVVGGSTPSTSDPDNFDGNVPWLTPRDLAGPHDRYISHGARNLSQKGLDSCSAKLLPHGAVLLTTRAPIGYVAIARNPIATNQGFRSLILRDGCVPEYLYYWLIANSRELELRGSGTTFPELSGSSLKEICLSLPPLPEQRAIAHVLGTLDDKIELNRRMNETLEEMARALFKDWFVDFGPVCAKLQGRAPYLPPALWSLFPDRLVPSELGDIPEGWEAKPLGVVVDVVGGTTPSTKVAKYWEEGIHCWATPKDLSALSAPVLLNTERLITDEGLRQIGSGLLPPGTLLLSSRAPIGYLAVAEVPVAINQGFIAMPPRKGSSNLFMLHWCKAFHDEIINRANGSTFLEINKSNFRQIPILVPSSIMLSAWHDLASVLHKRIVANEIVSRMLIATRDLLLNKLVSGETRLQWAEPVTFVER